MLSISRALPNWPALAQCNPRTPPERRVPLFRICAALIVGLVAIPVDLSAQGNVNRGRQLAEDRRCISCHTAENPYTVSVPRIEGQKIYYLAKQLTEFREPNRSAPYSQSKGNERHHLAMDWQSERLSDADIRD